MEFMRILKLTEESLTSALESVGVERFSEDDSRELNLNADFIIHDTIIELKLVDEEGLDKKERRVKLANLFNSYKHPKADVCVLDPDVLTEQDFNKYKNIMRSPIKNHIKKANKQLRASTEKQQREMFTAVFIVNNGYGALSHEEFLEISKHCVRNDTSAIDYLICGGMYFHSDMFDSYVLCPIDVINIKNKSPLESEDEIREAWNGLSEKIITKMMHIEPSKRESKLPVIDIEFCLDNVTYVKLPPPFGKESEFWPNGRPRINSSSFADRCPYIATPFPKLKLSCWEHIKNNQHEEYYFKQSYQEWLKYVNEQEIRCSSDSKPFVQIPLDNSHIEDLLVGEFIKFNDLILISNHKFEAEIRKVMESARNITEQKIDLLNYILVEIHEIGRDKNNDFCQIFEVRTINGKIYKKSIVEYIRAFEEYAIAIASAYCLKHELECVLYQKHKKYTWC
jgi:hypothetical protein